MCQGSIWWPFSWRAHHGTPEIFEELLLARFMQWFNNKPISDVSWIFDHLNDANSSHFCCWEAWERCEACTKIKITFKKGCCNITTVLYCFVAVIAMSLGKRKRPTNLRNYCAQKLNFATNENHALKKYITREVHRHMYLFCFFFLCLSPFTFAQRTVTMNTKYSSILPSCPLLSTKFPAQPRGAPLTDRTSKLATADGEVCRFWGAR